MNRESYGSDYKKYLDIDQTRNLEITGYPAIIEIELLYPVQLLYIERAHEM